MLSNKFNEKKKKSDLRDDVLVLGQVWKHVEDGDELGDTTQRLFREDSEQRRQIPWRLVVGPIH